MFEIFIPQHSLTFTLFSLSVGSILILRFFTIPVLLFLSVNGTSFFYQVFTSKTFFWPLVWLIYVCFGRSEQSSFFCVVCGHPFFAHLFPIHLLETVLCFISICFLLSNKFFSSFAIYHLAECGCESVKRRLQAPAAFYYNFATFALDLKRFWFGWMKMEEYDHQQDRDVDWVREG